MSSSLGRPTVAGMSTQVASLYPSTRTAQYVCSSCLIRSHVRTASRIQISSGFPHATQHRQSRHLHWTGRSAKVGSSTNPLRRERWGKDEYKDGASALGSLGIVHKRSYRTSVRLQDGRAAAESRVGPNTKPSLESLLKSPSTSKTSTSPQKPAESKIRQQLRLWQQNFGAKWDLEHMQDTKSPFPSDALPDGEMGAMSRLREQSKNESDHEDEHADEEMRNLLSKMSNEDGDLAGLTTEDLLKPGSLVELGGAGESKDSNMLAIYVRHVLHGSIGQYLTIFGRWMHFTDRKVTFALPGFVSQSELDSLTRYLPTPETSDQLQELRDKYVSDQLDVPRDISGPLVARMSEFQRESREVYRKNASALDNAHEIVADYADLRYGTLTSLTSKLLDLPPESISPVALYTVQIAIRHAGIGFAADPRFYRATGHIQIRSKALVRTVEFVRNWVRHWQHDLAITAAMTPSQRQKHTPSVGAQHVYGFLGKVREIVLKNRKVRDPTAQGNVGPSKTKRELTPTSKSIKITSENQFTEPERELINFIESWACAGTFLGHTSLSALPPILLQATGLYDDQDMGIALGYMFLQEVGTILPFENKATFDPFLLLPSSGQSKPLQSLMGRLVEMKGNHDLEDSMADLRHDWGSLPVFCIDGASAHEIDDGVSVESDPDGGMWVHVHIANPTAYFSHDHPLAKMSQHMGESIYMPERTYRMMPRWATDTLFSLAPDRPCLTFSAKFDSEWNLIDKKVRNGIVRNVICMTPEELDNTIYGWSNETKATQDSATVLTVGGEVPPPPSRQSAVSSLKETDHDALKSLRRLSIARFEARKAAGGVFLDSQKPEISVWHAWHKDGLGWEAPFRHGRRTVEGDPVIQITAQYQSNWFKPSVGPANILVREAMLLACEIAARWCADRQIPMLYRGTVPSLVHDNPELFMKEKLLPAAAQNDGIYPMHLGLDYVRKLGKNVLSAVPLKHKVLGMDYYSKVTSPLRRYGDMIAHWQIEAALREEARTGKSLATTDESVDRSFVTFSTATLQNIMPSLATREKLVTMTKSISEEFWLALFVFRAFHYNETKLPFDTFRVTVFAVPAQSFQYPTLGVLCHELGANMAMLRPEKLNIGLETGLAGDEWECCLEHVDVFKRTITLRPIRLVSRIAQ